MTDKYDEAIEILTKDPGQIRIAWANYSDHPAGCLFDLVPEVGMCLTEIRDFGDAGTDLEQEILDDERIPEDRDDITPEDLPVFAEWQRKIDAEYPDRD